MRVIPAIDIIDGQLVRLTKGNYQQKKVYSSNPLEVARSFEASGIEYLHLVDLDGAKAGKVINLKILEDICSKTSLQVDFGGGVKTKSELKRVFEAGAAQVTGGSIAVKDPEEFSSWLAEYGSEKIILGCDLKDGKVAVNGWQEQSQLEFPDLLVQFPDIKYVVCTDISQDGTLAGPSLALYQEIVSSFPELKLIASGGVGSFADILSLQEIAVEGVIVGKAIYEGKLSLEQLAGLE